MSENTYPAFYYFVVQRQITPTEYQVVEYENTDNKLSLTEAREELDFSLANKYQWNWEVLASAPSIDDAYSVIDQAIDVDEMLLGNSN